MKDNENKVNENKAGVEALVASKPEMTSSEIKADITRSVNMFRMNIGSAADSIHRAAVIYAECVEKYGERAIKAFEKEYPGVSKITWDKLIRVAGGKIIPELVLLSEGVSSKIAKMSIDEQRTLFGGAKTVKVAVAPGITRDVPLSRLSNAQSNLVFAEDGKVRPIEDQYEILKTRMEKRTCVSVPDYEVVGRILVVNRACKIGMDELLHIIEEMR